MLWLTGCKLIRASRGPVGATPRRSTCQHTRERRRVDVEQAGCCRAGRRGRRGRRGQGRGAGGAVVTIGYFLSAEEHDGPELVRMAVHAERAGFRTASVSDHFHPWLPEQGQSPFVWSVLGAIAQATTDLQVTTGVVCPTFRVHPVVNAQAAATTAQLLA